MITHGLPGTKLACQVSKVFKNFLAFRTVGLGGAREDAYGLPLKFVF